MKKILLVTRPLTPPWDEASKNFAYDLTRNFSAFGNCELHIMTACKLRDVPAHVVQHVVYTQSHFTVVQKIRSLLFQWKNRKTFDVVHYMFTPTILNVFLAKIILARRDVKTVQTVATVRHDLYSDKKLNRLLFGDVITTYSHYRQKELSQRFPDKNFNAIYPGIDLAKFHPTTKDEALMTQWKIAPQDFVVTYPGEFMRLGATDLIIDAFIKLWEDPENHNIKYLCACRIKNDADALRKKKVITKITAAGYRNHVIFTDTFGDMNAIYNLSDAIIFPVKDMSGKFDIPLAMVEPYACKKPVIASDLDLFAEFSNTDINVIIPTGSRDALQSAIITLRDDAQKRQQLGDNAFTFAHETFDIKKAVKSYQHIYEKL